MANLDPAFKPLEKLIGKWESKGRTLNAAEDNIFAETTFEPFLDGKYIKVTNHMTFDSENAKHVHDSLEVLWYDPERKVFPTLVYSTLGDGPGTTMEYEWEAEANGTIISRGGHAVYRGTFSKDGNVLTGGWRPDDSGDGRDEASYDLTMTRVS